MFPMFCVFLMIRVFQGMCSPSFEAFTKSVTSLASNLTSACADYPPGCGLLWPAASFAGTCTAAQLGAALAHADVGQCNGGVVKEYK